MTKASRDLRSCDNSNRNLRKLKQASMFSIFPQAQQDTNSEGSSFYPISPSLICKFRISDSNEPSQFLGLDGCSASEHCEHGSENVAIGEHYKHSTERTKTLLVSSLELFGASSKSDTKPTFTDFELFDPQFESCEKYHDNWLGLDSSSAFSHRECKRLDMSDIASSSDVSLSQGSFCLPPPNSVISSWSICNESKISLGSIYSEDYVGASNSNDLSSIGQWMCETVLESSCRGSELQLCQDIDRGTVCRPRSSVVEALFSFEFDFYGV